MKILLDSHTIIWFEEDDEQLPESVKALIEDEENEKFISIASIWEIAIKVGNRKLKLNKPIDDYFLDLLQRNGYSLLPIALPHALAVCLLPQHHKDPFDRLLITQSLLEVMPIVSIDSAFDDYKVLRLWLEP